MLFSPRRYGKTSLVKRVQNRLTAGGAVTIYADFFGLASLEDAATRLAKAALGFSHGRRNLWKAALKAMASFRPVLKPDAEGGVTLTVEPATGLKGLSLLEETLSNLGRLSLDTGKLIHVTFDEFQEIVVLKSSHRFGLEELRGWAEAAAFACARQWVDQRWPFAHSLLVAREGARRD